MSSFALASRLWFWFDIFIKELEHVLFPYWDRDVDRVVAIICCLANRRVNLQHVRLVQPFKLVCQGTARSCTVIVASLNEHDGLRRAAYGCEQPLADFRPARPGKIGGTIKGNRRSDGGITFGGE